MLNSNEQVFKQMTRTVEDRFNLAKSSGERRILIAVMDQMQQAALEYPEGHENKFSRTIEYIEKLQGDMNGHGQRMERITLQALLEDVKNLIPKEGEKEDA